MLRQKIRGGGWTVRIFGERSKITCWYSNYNHVAPSFLHPVTGIDFFLSFWVQISYVLLSCFSLLENDGRAEPADGPVFREYFVENSASETLISMIFIRIRSTWIKTGAKASVLIEIQKLRLMSYRNFLRRTEAPIKPKPARSIA